MRVAVVHDWLTVFGGAEQVLEQILSLFPAADLFAVIDYLPSSLRSRLQGKRARTTFIQHLPFAKRLYRFYLPLMPFAIEQLDVTGYDLVISSNTAVAKGVLIDPDQKHICYCNTPLRYAWDLQHQYLAGKLRPFSRYFLHKIRLWDVRSSHSVDTFIGNSKFIARRIEKCYRRRAEVVYPPVAIDSFPLVEKKEEFYVTASRLVGYKKIDLIVEAFRGVPNKKLFVIGEGPERRKIEKTAPKNVIFLGHLGQKELAEKLGKARAFLYAAIEDFGIAPLEAQSCGTPVIAYGKGGVKETCEQTGCFFMEQTSESIRQAIETFEKGIPFSPLACRKNAERFSKERFCKEFLKIVGV